MEWSDPATLKALDPQGGQWAKAPDSFRRAAQRILGPNREAVEEAVNLSLAALATALKVLADVVRDGQSAPFSQTVRDMRADPELRALFKARYASETVTQGQREYPGVPTMLTDPFCLESRPASYWFDGDTCEMVVSAFIGRQTLNRRRALLDVHESGVTYSLRGSYRNSDSSIRIDFHGAEDAEIVGGDIGSPCRYYIHPIYEYRKSVRKLSGAEVVLSASNSTVLDIDFQTGDLVNCFEGYVLSPSGGQSATAPYLVETGVRVRKTSDLPSLRAADLARAASSPILNQYAFTLVKRAVSDSTHQVAMNRAVTEYFDPETDFGEFTGWTLKYAQWIHGLIGDGPAHLYSISKLTSLPEDKVSPTSPRGVAVETENARLNAFLALWLQAQTYLSELPTGVDVYLRANLPKSLRELARDSDSAKPGWAKWANSLPPGHGLSAKRLIDSWSTVWKLLELTLQNHNDDRGARITYQEFVEAMPVRVYANYESEFELMRRQAPELSETI